jgi:hypothetical protein
MDILEILNSWKTPLPSTAQLNTTGAGLKNRRGAMVCFRFPKFTHEL